jgi:hypothetical protein
MFLQIILSDTTFGFIDEKPTLCFGDIFIITKDNAGYLHCFRLTILDLMICKLGPSYRVIDT